MEGSDRNQRVFVSEPSLTVQSFYNTRMHGEREERCGGQNNAIDQNNEGRGHQQPLPGRIRLEEARMVSARHPASEAQAACSSSSSSSSSNLTACTVAACQADYAVELRRPCRQRHTIPANREGRNRARVLGLAHRTRELVRAQANCPKPESAPVFVSRWSCSTKVVFNTKTSEEEVSCPPWWS